MWLGVFGTTSTKNGNGCPTAPAEGVLGKKKSPTSDCATHESSSTRAAEPAQQLFFSIIILKSVENVAVPFESFDGPHIFKVQFLEIPRIDLLLVAVTGTAQSGNPRRLHFGLSH
jgi:hypothetical protein